MNAFIVIEIIFLINLHMTASKQCPVEVQGPTN